MSEFYDENSIFWKISLKFAKLDKSATIERVWG